MLKLIGNALMWASIVIAISGIAYSYWIGTQDMFPVYVAAGIGVFAGTLARYVGANAHNLRFDRDGWQMLQAVCLVGAFRVEDFLTEFARGRLSAPVLCRDHQRDMRKFWIILAVLLILIIVASRVVHFPP